MDYNVRMMHSATQPTNTWVTSKDESREMMALWPDVVRDLTDSTKNFVIPDIAKWMAKVNYYLLKLYNYYCIIYMKDEIKIHELVCINLFENKFPQYDRTL